MADNFNISTTQSQANEAGGLDNNNPAMTYVDFANQIARNSATQQEQAAQVANAQLQLKQRQQASAMGVNPELQNFLPIDEAVAELKAAGVDDDTIQDFMQSIGNQQVVNRASIDTIIRKKMLSTKLSVAGKSFKTTDNITIPSGMKAEDLGLVPDPTQPGVGHVPSDGEYQVSVDPNSGQPTSYIALGETPAAPGANKEEAAEKKGWHDLEKLFVIYTKSMRGNAVMQTITRAKQALALLASFGDNPPTPVLNSVYSDVGSIMTGAAATQESTELASYKNILTDLNNNLGYYIGKYSVASTVWGKMTGNKIPPLNEILNNLKKTLTELLQTAAATVKAQLESSKAGYSDIIEKDPQRFDDMVNSHMAVTNAGLPGGMTSGVSMGETPAEAPASSNAASPTRKPLTAIFSGQ